jgi:predicted permease
VTRLRVLLSRLLDVVLRRQRESRLSEEIQTHLDLLTEQHIAAGLSPDAARTAARRAFGGVAQVKETYRDQRGLPQLGTIGQDVRFAVRMLAKDRRFTVATVLALGLGVGSVTAVFAILNTMVIRDLPFSDARRLVRIGGIGEDRRSTAVFYDDYVELARRVTAFDGILANGDDGGYAVIGDVADRPQYPPDRVRRTTVSANAFAVLGAAPALGRGFRPEDDIAGAPSVAVISDDLWRFRYGADVLVIGRSIAIDDVPSTIVGVMPPRFTWPMINQLWQPLGASPAMTPARRARTPVTLTARLRPGVTLARANAELAAAVESLPAHPPPLRKIRSMVATPLRDSISGGPNALRIVSTLMGVAALVLVIACANAASLLLARSVTRAREIAIRAAVGASRWRIVRQLLIECLGLASLAGLLGAVLSRYGARFLATGFDLIEPGLPNATPYWIDLSMDTSAYLFIAAVCLVTTLGFGLGPALHLSRLNASDVLKTSGLQGTGRAGRWSGVLVTAEIALTLVLLTGAGLMWRSFVALYQADRVIDTSRLSTMRVGLPTGPGQTDDTRRAFLARITDRLSASGKL